MKMAAECGIPKWHSNYIYSTNLPHTGPPAPAGARFIATQRNFAIIDAGFGELDRSKRSAIFLTISIATLEIVIYADDDNDASSQSSSVWI